MRLIIEVDETGGYCLCNEDGEMLSEGTLFDGPSLAVDVCAIAEINR